MVHMCVPHALSLLMLMLINSIYPRANLATKVTTAAPWGLSSVNYRWTVLVSTTVILGMAVVHSNIWDQKLRRHVNQMWQSLYAGSQDRLGLLLADDDELWQLTVVRTEMTDMMGPAHVDICRRAGKVCRRYVDRTCLCLFYSVCLFCHLSVTHYFSLWDFQYRSIQLQRYCNQ